MERPGLVFRLHTGNGGKGMSIFKSNAKTVTVEVHTISDQQLADQLKDVAQETANLGGELVKRGWRVSIMIYAHTSDKGPIAHVDVSRTQTLVGE